jgi:hypothetical protein
MSTLPAPASPAGASVVPGLETLVAETVLLSDITCALAGRYRTRTLAQLSRPALRVYFDYETHGPVTELDRACHAGPSGFSRYASDADILIERTLARVRARNLQRGITTHET